MIEDAGILSNDAKHSTLSRQELIANTWVFLFAGAETSANSLHYALVLLALHPSVQRSVQADLDAILGDKPLSQWDYKADCDRIFASTLGAVVSEQLRLIPAIVAIPKQVKHSAGDKTLSVDGRPVVIPEGSFVHMNAYSVHRNPRYWPHGPSKRTSAATDLSDFVPERWMPGSYSNTEPKLNRKSGETKLFVPPHGAYIPFSEGARACLGRRFALVEITAVLAAIFRTYSVELDVSEWVSPKHITSMSGAEKNAVYEQATAKAWKSLDSSLNSLVTLQLPSTKAVPLRLVKRGGEIFI